MRLTFLMLSVLFIGPMGMVAQPAADEARQIFEEVEKRQKSLQGEMATLLMEIVDTRGRTRTRSMTLHTKLDTDGHTKSLLVFDKPADIRGMGLLTIETRQGNEQRLYLPSLKRVQRIAGSKRSGRFGGSDFTYEDLGTYDPDAFETRILETRPEAWLLEARALNETSQYGRLVLEIDRTRYVLNQVSYYDRKDRLIKELTSEAFSEVETDIWRANRMTMRDAKDGRYTILTFQQREVVDDLSDALFTERQLKRGLH